MGASKRRKTSDAAHASEGDRRRGRNPRGTENDDCSCATRPLQLNEGDAVVVVGRGSLIVLRGHVKVHGKVLRGNEDGSVRLPLACDASFPVCVQSLGGGLESEGQGIPYAAARFAEVAFEGVEVERVPSAFAHFFPKEWTDVAEEVAKGMQLRVDDTEGSVEYTEGSVEYTEEIVTEKLAAGSTAPSSSPPSTSRRTSHPPRPRDEGEEKSDLFVAVVCGSKNTGKSSFSRYLINTLLNTHESVLFLDTDCGQPEYTPPGLVSMFRVTEPMIDPTYMTRYAPPLASHYIGDTSPGSDPALYQQSVSTLFTTWGLFAGKRDALAKKSRTRKGRAMVINTHGWIQGLGLDVLGRFLQRVTSGARQVALVRMQADNPRHNLPNGLFFTEDHPEEAAHVLDYHLPAISSACPSCVAAKRVRDSLGFSRTRQAANATEKRVMQWHNFARHCVISLDGRSPVSHGTASITETWPTDDCHRNDAFDLTRQRPYRIGLDAVTLSFFEGFIPEDDDRALQSVNGCVVGLCGSPVGDDVAPCYGVGIVRSVCARTRSLYVLTPVPLKVLTAHVDRLVVGRACDLPNSLLAGSPYLAVGCVGGGGSVRSSRGNLVRVKNRASSSQFLFD